MPWLFQREKDAAPFLQPARDALGSLRRVSEAAASKGAASLGRLARQPVALESTSAAIVPVRALEFHLSRHASGGALASLRFGRDAQGFGALAFAQRDALALLDHVLGKPAGSTRQLGELEQSALAEAGNIVLNAMMGGVARASGSSFSADVPELTFRPRERLALLSRPQGGEDHAIVMETDLALGSPALRGSTVLVLFVRAGPDVG